ncbi:immunoglobulin lambda-1 light chain-like [Narcine bancroftii]|uniref:immunoglobulin lambda-1 light chain-like n=1 Tax=Narcine bancroftii TaxID=1343680 RepID=UPI00383160C2
MVSALGLLWSLMVWVPGVLALVKLHQTPMSDPLSAGQTVHLECRLEGGSVASYYMNWYRQRPGEAPEWVLEHQPDNDIYRGSGFTSRFAPSRDTSANTHTLTIRSLEAGDSAVYYCATWDGSANEYVFGPGSTLIVTSSDSRKPSVQLLPPSQNETDSGSATLSCLVSGFKPGFASLRWSVDGVETESGVTTGVASPDADQTYKQSSYLHVSATAWNTGSSYTCIVSHSSLSSPLRESISSLSCV